MNTFFIEASYGNTYKDYYITAGCLKDALDEARERFAGDFNVPRGMRNFITVTV